MIKYSIPFKSADDVNWQVDIDVPAFTGTATNLRGVRGEAAVLSYDGETDDPFSVIFRSSLSVQVYFQDSTLIDVRELQQSQDRQVVILLYRETTLFWKGYLDANGLQRPLRSAPFGLQLKAVDGLELLDNVPYVHADLPAFGTGSTRCPLNYFRQILNSPDNLGLALPIRWTNYLECTAFPSQDVFTGEVTWSKNGEAFLSYQSGQFGQTPGPAKSCLYILEGILRAMQCRIFQTNGRWTIRRVPDMVSNPTLYYKQVSGTLLATTIQTGSESLLKQIGNFGYNFQNEDQIMTNKPGVKSCKVVYQADIRENILPNGSQDYENTVLPNEALYWYLEPSGVAAADLALDGRNGRSIRLTNNNLVNDYYSTGYIDSLGAVVTTFLPIDTKNMVKRLSFGFIFNPITGNYDAQPLLVRVIFKLGGVDYYLNEFGFWVTTPGFIPITIAGIGTGDVVKVDFDRFQGILMPEPENVPVAGSVSELQVSFVVRPGNVYAIDNIYLTIDQGYDVYESINALSKETLVDERELSISTSFNGYMLSNLMSGWDKSDVECYFRDGLLYTGTLTGLTANAIMRCRYLPSEIYNGSMNVRNANWSFDEIYLIESRNTLRYLPLNANYNVEKAEVFLVAMECRNDNAIFTQKMYNSNDQILSN